MTEAQTLAWLAFAVLAALVGFLVGRLPKDEPPECFHHYPRFSPPAAAERGCTDCPFARACYDMES